MIDNQNVYAGYDDPLTRKTQIIPPVPGKLGIGIPTGGTTGQVLKKKTDADGDVEWGEGGGGGITADTYDLATEYAAADVQLSNLPLCFIGAPAPQEPGQYVTFAWTSNFDGSANTSTLKNLVEGNPVLSITNVSQEVSGAISKAEVDKLFTNIYSSADMDELVFTTNGTTGTAFYAGLTPVLRIRLQGIKSNNVVFDYSKGYVGAQQLVKFVGKEPELEGDDDVTSNMVINISNSGIASQVFDDACTAISDDDTDIEYDHLRLSASLSFIKGFTSADIVELTEVSEPQSMISQTAKVKVDASQFIMAIQTRAATSQEVYIPTT